MRQKLDALRIELTFLIEKDARSFDAVILAMKKPKYTEHEIAVRDTAIEDATKVAASVPLEVMEKTIQIMKYLPVIAEKGNVNSVSDAGVANLMAKSAIEGASMNVRINLGSIRDKAFADDLRTRMNAMLEESNKLFEKTKAIVESKLG